MRHVPEGVLRRLDDEPLAIPDRVIDHVAECGHCSARRAAIAQDTERVAQVLSPPQLVPDTDLAFARFQQERSRGAVPAATHRVDPGRSSPSMLPRVSLRAGLALGAVGVVVAGTAAAATFTTIFAPTHLAPVSVSPSELQAVSSALGLSEDQALGGFDSPKGSSPLRFGTLRWSSGNPRNVSSVAQASARAGFSFPLPSELPAGVGAIQQLTVQPRASATVTFGATAGALTGSTVTLTAGPAVAAQYGGRTEAGVPTLAVAEMPRPTAHSSGASLSEIEAFLLRQPGIPPQLAEEVRLLGDLRTTLPVPVPDGVAVRSVQVRGWPGVLLADSSNAAAAAVWEDGQGMLHTVAGILDPHDVLNVADQLG